MTPSSKISNGHSLSAVCATSRRWPPASAAGRHGRLCDYQSSSESENNGKDDSRSDRFPPDEVFSNPELYFAGAGMFLKAVGLLDEHCQSAMLVGHNPAITEFANGYAMGESIIFQPAVCSSCNSLFSTGRRFRKRRANWSTLIIRRRRLIHG